MDKSNNSENYFNLRKNKFKTNIKELAGYFANLRGKKIKESSAAGQIWNLYKKELQFNIFKKDKLDAWLFTHAISELKIAESGDIEYSLPSIVFEQLGQQNGVHISFAKLDLLVCLRIKSKFAGILYEFFQDYIESPQVPKIALQKIKKSFGLKENYTFRDIKKRCLEPAIKEINANPDIPFTVKLEVIHDGQTPAAVKFKIETLLSEEDKEKIKNGKPYINFTRNKVNDVHLPKSNKKIDEQEQNQKFTENNMTDNQAERVPVPSSHKKIKEQEQNQKLTENNMTDINMNGVPDFPPEPENQIPEILPERVKELCARIDLSRLPVENQREIKERYKYALEDNNV